MPQSSFHKSILFAFLFVVLFSCSKKEEDDGKIKIVTTTGHIADMVRHVVGDKAHVEALMGPGVDPHLYKASLSDLKKLSSADVIFYNGLHLEGKMSEIFHKLSRTRKVVAISNGIPDSLLLLADSAAHIPDPHIWFDVRLWRYCLQEVNEQLGLYYPEFSHYFNSNKAQYDTELYYLDSLVKNQIGSIPKQQRILVTAHDAFSYFGRAYDIEVMGLQGISTLSEYGLNEITTLTKLLVSKNIRAVFVETSVSEKAIQSVIEGCREKGHEMKIGGSLYSDALGDPSTPEGQYVGMFRANVRLITEGLKK
jgi:manganese/zinc/iron transport system substrate-binding protein